MAITKNSQIDLNGNEMILDADGDTSITADTDDQIDLKVGGTDRATFLLNNLHLNGGTDARIQLGTGGAGANQVSNNTVHVRGDGTSMKLMAASGGSYLFETNGTAVFQIDSAGIVTKPLQPYFHAYRSADQTGFSTSSFGDAVVFNAEILDLNSDFNTSTGLFTAPVDGTYWFIGSIYSATNTIQQAWLAINTGSGAARATYTDFITTASFSNVYSSVHYVHLDANDTVGLHPYTSASSTITITASAYHTYFKGGLLY